MGAKILKFLFGYRMVFSYIMATLLCLLDIFFIKNYWHTVSAFLLGWYGLLLFELVTYIKRKC